MKRLTLLSITITLIALLSVISPTQAAPSATITVTSSGNSGAGTLRQAILDANPGDTIVFDGNKTINFTGSSPIIDKALTIDGETNTINLRGGSNIRSGFELTDGADVTLRNLSFENGEPRFTSRGGALEVDGAIVDGAFTVKLTIEGCVFRNNSGMTTSANASWDGGALYLREADVVIRDSEFIDNISPDNSNPNNGGAISVNGSHLRVERTLFDGNSADNGGAIYATDAFNPSTPSYLEIIDSTFFDNVARLPIPNPNPTGIEAGGGAIYLREGVQPSLFSGNLFERNQAAGRGGALYFRNVQQHRIENSTFYNNHADNLGGALSVSGSYLNHLTVVGNTSARVGGGIYAPGSATRNSIIAGNFIDSDGVGSPDGPANDCAGGSSHSLSNTLVEADTIGCNVYASSGNLLGVDPDLSTLSPAANGGETETFALDTTSPAIDAGDTASCRATDQRGFLRIGGACDMGAYETNTSVRCATYDGRTERLSFNADALFDALANIAERTIKVAGSCFGATSAGGSILSAFIAEGITLEGGHTVVNWDGSADSDANPTIIDPLGAGRVVLITGDSDVVLSHLTLQNGLVLDSEGGILYTEANGTVTLDTVTIRGGSADNGGGIFNQGSDLIIRNSSILDNVAKTLGGGVMLEDGTLNIENSTLSNNTALEGAGIRTESGTTSTINNVTIARSHGTQNGSNDGLSNEGTMAVTNSIVSDSSTGNDCDSSGTLTISNSLVEDGSCITANVNGNLAVDPELDVLAKNEGTAWTHAIVLNSPPQNSGGSGCPATDQRELPRADGACDMGAYEFGAMVPTAVGLSEQLAVSSHQGRALYLLLLWSVVSGLSSLLLWQRKKFVF